MDPLARAGRLAARQYGAISSAQARACGLTRDQVRQLVRSGRWAAVHRGVYLVVGSALSWEQQASIALLASGDAAALSFGSAAFLHELTDAKPSRIDVTVPYGARPRSAKRFVIHRAVSLDAPDTRTVRRLRVTCPARTLVDLASAYPEPALASAIDHALLSGRLTIGVVRRYIRDRGLRSRPGAGMLVKLLDDREFGVPESELERRMLELIAENHLPAPERQRRVGPHRVDFAYPAQGVIVEVDGRATHGTAEAFESDPVRQNALVLDGWTVLRFTWKQITRDPDYVADALSRVLQGAARLASPAARIVE
jgi:very-short-patch-repair endonuclease